MTSTDWAARRRVGGARAFLQRRRGLWPLVPVLLFLGVFLVYPMVGLFSRSFFDPSGHLSVFQFQRLLDRPVYLRVLRTSFEISAWTTLICVVLGYPVAYYLARASEDLRNKLLLVVLMPFWTGLLVRTLAWVILLSDSGPIIDLAKTAGIDSLRLTYNLTGVLVSMVQAYMPLGILTMLPVMQRIDQNLVNAAASLGAPRAQSFWRVYFPLSLPGVAAGALIIFITTLGNFTSPMVLGSPKETMIAPVIITQVQDLLNWGFAGVLSLVLLLSTLLVYFAYERTLGLSQLVGGSDAPAKRGPRATATGARFRWSGAGEFILNRLGDGFAALDRAAGGGRRLGGPRWALLSAVALLLAFMALPSLFVIPVSLTKSTFLSFPPKGMSFRWYEELLTSPIWLAAATRSLVVGIATACLAMALGMAAAFVMTRQRFSGRSAVAGLMLSPMILPRISIAVAMFYLMAQLGLVGTTLGLVIGHTVIAFPYVLITVAASLSTYDRQLDQAAWMLGASKFRTFVHITLPNIRGGVVAAAIFAFMTSLDDLSIALFVAGGEQMTLPKQMWNSMTLQVSPILAAVSTLILIVMTAFVLFGEAARRRSR